MLIKMCVNRNFNIKVLHFYMVFGLLMLLLTFPVHAEESDRYEPTLYGLSGIFGYTYDPSDTAVFAQASFCAVYDYDRIWHHRAPDALRFKVEGSAGVSSLENGDLRLISNANVMALYYLESLESDKMKPYVEAGIGLIYMDYRVDEQAYRINFNPQAGFGFEFKRKSGQINFIAFRLHHISNGGLNQDNRGQNSAIVMIGQYF